MPLPPDAYRGREQTYLKHFFLHRYLERVAYNICSFRDEFVFVDGFAGPWRSADDELADTSFRIAIEALQGVRRGCQERSGRSVRMSAVFVCHDDRGRRRIEAAARSVTDVHVTVLRGEFETCIPVLLGLLGERFALCFVDPTGWKGFALARLQPLLSRRDTEVVVNFMYDYINRFIGQPGQAENFEELFGSSEWRPLLETESRREERLVELYCRRLREVGGFEHAASTRIMKPLVDRTYFHLVYGTHHWKGLLEFRNVERAAFPEQERVRDGAKRLEELQRTGQQSLFASNEPSPGAHAERRLRLEEARRALDEALRSEGRILYRDAMLRLLEIPLVWESDVKDIVTSLKKEGRLVLDGLGPRERVPKHDKAHFLVAVPEN